jgi:hypothetical protein
MEPQCLEDDVNETVFTLKITGKKPNRFNYGVKVWKVPLPSYPKYTQNNEIKEGFNDNIKDLKKCVASENSCAPMGDHQRWLLKITGSIWYKGKVRNHEPFQVLKNIWRLKEYPLFMCMAQNGSTNKANILMEDFNLEDNRKKTLDSLKKEFEAAGNLFPGQSYKYVSINHSTEDTHRHFLSLQRESAAAMKEFCNEEVEYTNLDRLALDT